MQAAEKKPDREQKNVNSQSNFHREERLEVTMKNGGSKSEKIVEWKGKQD